MILISNPSRQHTPHLLYGCLKFNQPALWFTSFWFNPLKWYWKVFLFILPSFSPQMLKRFSSLIVAKNVHFNFLGMQLFFFSRFIFSPEKRNFLEDRWHDLWVASKIKSLKPTVVIGSEKCSINSFLKAKKYGAILVLDLAGNHVNEIKSLRERYPFYCNTTGSNILFNKIKKIKKKEYKIADKILVLSQFIKNNLIKNGVCPSKIHVINIGFDPKRFLLKKFYNSIFSTPLRIIYCGIITKRKGVHLIAQIAKALDYLAIDWVFVGTKDDGYNCVNNSKNSKYIPFSEHDQLVYELHKADLFVFPSYSDSWGMAVIEAMACGLPVIISENTGAKDAVTNDCGFVIPIDDADALAEKVLYFYNNRSEIERMGRNASKQAQKYTWDNYYKQVNEFINTISS